MNVPVEILEKLKCSNCEELLSCGPVVLKQDGSNICGRCSSVEEAAVPNLPYNSLASLCTFPCKYSAEGCHEKLPFSSVQPHEADCAFRTYICPVAPSGSCEWIGCKNKILEHTRDMHPEQVLQHPCEMTHDVRTASCNTFLTAVFDVLFLVHVKVCLVTHTIYHSVKKIGEIHERLIYKYQVNIDNHNGSVIRKGEVASQGCLALQEHTSLSLKINTIIEALCGYDEDTTCTITLQEYMQCFICKVVKIADQMEVHNRTYNIFYCKTCSSTKLSACKYAAAGCLWRGQNKNHEIFFCPHNKYCLVCKEDIIELNMLEHVRNKKHKNIDVNHIFGKYWSMNANAKQENFTISFQNISFLFICYIENNSLRHFSIRSYHDVKLKCVLIFRNPVTKYALHYIMNKTYNSSVGQHFFKISLPDDKIQPFINDNKFEVGVDFYCYE